MPRQSPYTILLSDEEQAELSALAGRYTAPYCQVIRAKIVLYAARGMANEDIAARLELPRQVVSKWRKRFSKRRLHGLNDEPRPGRPPGFPPSRRRQRQGPRV